MLRIHTTKLAEQAKDYYTKGDDYYGHEIIGDWGGKGAERLGLRGQVDKVSFDELVKNLNPLTGEKLTVRDASQRRVGFDFNFHCPKSVSLIHAFTKDARILDAFRASVHETMQEIETEAKTRVRIKNTNEDRVTGNMIWAEYIHLTSRPVDGISYPHIHGHLFLPNCSYDPIENRFKAIQIGDLKRDAPYFEAAFHARLAQRLATLGYPIERTAKGWEIAGISRATIEKFSQRTLEIERVAKEKGITNPKLKAELGAKTRKSKRTGIDRAALEQHWNEQLTAEEKHAIQSVKQHKSSQRVTPEEALRHATQLGFERHSVVSTKRLAAYALKFGVGHVTVEDIQQAMNNHDLITRDVDGQLLCTTPEVYREEQAMLDLARAGRGRCERLGSDAYQCAKDSLTDEQKAAVKHVLTSQDRVMAIRGAAGTGKTTLMQEALAAIVQNGKTVYTFAPSAEASRGVLRQEGFENAETVALLLKDPKRQEQLKDQVMWIDEAGLLSAKDMKRIFEIARDQNARVILSGDYGQHASIERGDALRLLEHHAGISFAELSLIRRQKGGYRYAIRALSRGKVEVGYDLLDAMGAIQEVRDEDRYELLANDYVQAAKDGKTALIVSPMHAEGERVTKILRHHLREQGTLKGAEKNFTQQHNLSLTAAERTQPELYEPGHIVQIHQNISGFEPGERVTVLSHDNGAVLVTNSAGKTKALPLHLAERFQVYTAQPIALAKGDRIRITQNGKTADKSHRLNNGAMYEVKGFTHAGDIELTNGWVIDKSYGNLADGYCTTSHASQGRTVDRVFIAQSAESFGAASREQFYVSTSRGREQLKIYTDDKDALKAAILKSGERMSATDLVTPDATRERQRALQKQAVLVNRMATLEREHTGRILNPLVKNGKLKIKRMHPERDHELQRDIAQ